MVLARSSVHFHLPLRYGSIIVFVISAILFPIWVSDEYRGPHVIILGLVTAILSAGLAAYMILFGVSGRRAILGVVPRYSASANPDVFRWWARVFKPIPRLYVAGLDMLFMWMFIGTLIPFNARLTHTHWGPVVLGSYCAMMLTCGAFVHFFSLLQVTLPLLFCGLGAVLRERRRAANRNALVLCPNCGTHVVEEGDTEGLGSRQNLSLYERVFGASDDDHHDRLLIGDTNAEAPRAEEYKDEPDEPRPEHAGQQHGTTSAAADETGSVVHVGVHDDA